MKERIYINRLKRLKKIIEKVPEEKINMLSWFDETECGTTACVLGWASLDKSFRRAGLKSYKRIGGKICFKPTFKFDIDRNIYNIEFTYQNAGKAFFGLSFYETNYLFVKLCYSSNQKSEMLNRIQQIIDKKEYQLKYGVNP